jgi:4-hydroxythreonine-4-phosphate dehydrogenase
MMLVAPKLIATHVSTHVSLQEAIRRVKKDRILNVARLTSNAVKLIRPQARIAIAALNPHAGENRKFGNEDLDEIAPAVAAARAEGIDAYGPVPADTLFMKALAGQYDAVVCMYHDQGHIPLKMIAFHEGVNTTIGLPIIRTSVDHGTAFDIAYKGIASTENLIAAFNLAVTMAGNRKK